jgi:WXXGXW repeat (2 copies)
MIDDYDALIGLIYGGVMDDTPWSLALAEVADCIGATCRPMSSTASEALAPTSTRPNRRLARDNTIWREIGRRREPLSDRGALGNLGAGSCVLRDGRGGRPMDRRSEPAEKDIAMQRSMRLLLCASTAALILGAAPIGAFVTPAQAQVEVSISATIAPPLLPVYAQPAIPGPGYLWVPGYWAWNGSEYFWTPGYWSMPPTVGFYWTPPYWGWLNGAYVFNAGYWGPTVGFYGGINYGFGYNGVGYQGGMWQGNTFVYNRTVSNFGNVRIANTYSRPVSNPANHVAFNGGNGGTTARPTQAEMAARAKGAPPTAAQMQHQEAAGKDPALGFNANHGNPPIAAMQRPNEFHGAAAATNAPAEHPQAATPERPQAATAAQPARPQAASHAPAPPQHYAYRAPATRQHYAYHAPVAHAHVAYHAPAARPHVAYRAPVVRQHVAVHAPVMRPNVAYRAPAMHLPAMHAVARPHVSAPVKRTP